MSGSMPTVAVGFLVGLHFRPFLSLSGPQSRFGDKLFRIGVVCPRNGTAVLKGVSKGHQQGYTKEKPTPHVFVLAPDRGGVY